MEVTGGETFAAAAAPVMAGNGGSGCAPLQMTSSMMAIHRMMQSVLPRRGGGVAKPARKAPKEKGPLKVWKGGSFPRLKDVFPAARRDQFGSLSTMFVDYGCDPLVYADYKSAKEVMAALNSGGHFFCIGSPMWLDGTGAAGVCVNLADMVALGWRSTGSLRFNRGIKTTAFAIVDGKAVPENSREAKAARKARGE